MTAKKAPTMNLISSSVIGGMNVAVYRSDLAYKEVPHRLRSFNPEFVKYERLSRPLYQVEIDGDQSPISGMHGCLVDASEFGQWLIGVKPEMAFVAEVRGEVESCGHWTDDQMYAESVPFGME